MTSAANIAGRPRSGSRLRTAICDRLGIEAPVFQAGMGWVARAELAAAVSAAGGLGVVGAGSTNGADELRAEIRGVRERTERPFGVDILFATVRAAGDEAARYTDQVRAMVEVVLEERVPVLISGLGSPKAVVPGLIDNEFTRSWAAREGEILPYPLQGIRVGHPASERGRLRGEVETGVLPAGRVAA